MRPSLGPAARWLALWMRHHRTTKFRRARWWAVAELLVAAALVAGANLWDLVPVSETPWLVALGWLSLRLRGLAWGTLGLRRPNRWVTTIVVAIGAAVLLQLLSEFVIEQLTGRPDLSDFEFLVGNLPGALGMLALVWTLAAFGEEMAYRGQVQPECRITAERPRASPSKTGGGPSGFGLHQTSQLARDSLFVLHSSLL